MGKIGEFAGSAKRIGKHDFLKRIKFPHVKELDICSMVGGTKGAWNMLFLGTGILQEFVIGLGIIFRR